MIAKSGKSCPNDSLKRLQNPMAIERYNAAEAEARWQKVWEERGIFATKNDDVRKKY